MRVLITGGAGFIGSHLSSRFLKEGHTVCCLDNFDPYYNPLVKKKNITHLLPYKKFTFYKVDICNRALIEKIFVTFKPDVVCHLASKVGVRASIVSPEDYIRTNIEGTQNILDASVKYNVRHLVFASSSSVYGDSPHKLLSEKDRCVPISPYGVTKYAAERLIEVQHRLYHLRATILRFFTVYGPGGRPDMAPYLFVDRIDRGIPITLFGNGLTSRDYTYVEDIVDGICSAIKHNYSFEIINLGGGNPVSLNRFIAIVEKLLGKGAIIRQDPRQQGDMEKTHADISKARRLLGFRPKVALEEGIEEFIHWYRGNRS